ncbi:hypothetical protein Gotur_017102 [Gossypium turneri]
MKYIYRLHIYFCVNLTCISGLWWQLVSPGAWLTDMCQERYEAREKKSSKKGPRGLKAIESIEIDSD